VLRSGLPGRNNDRISENVVSVVIVSLSHTRESSRVELIETGFVVCSSEYPPAKRRLDASTKTDLAGLEHITVHRTVQVPYSWAQVPRNLTPPRGDSRRAPSQTRVGCAQRLRCDRRAHRYAHCRFARMQGAAVDAVSAGLGRRKCGTGHGPRTLGRAGPRSLWYVCMYVGQSSASIFLPSFHLPR
jgi:hypothetical protein